MTFNPPDYNSTCNVWATLPLGQPAGAPNIANLRCFGRKPQSNESFTFAEQGIGVYLILEVPPGTLIQDYVGSFLGPAPTPVSVIEYPAGSGDLYYVELVLTVGRNYPNEHKDCYLVRYSPASVTT